jgi:two-component system, NarL family, sensor kinase
MSVRTSSMRNTKHKTEPAIPEVGEPNGRVNGHGDANGNGHGDTSASAETLTRRLHRLALDVHDGPMQNLAVIGFSLGDLRRRMRAVLPPEHHPNIDEGLGQITDELGKVESELRLLIGALEQGATRSVPLRDAIEVEIREFEGRFQGAVEFLFDDNARAHTDSQRIALQSVTRAALANVAKHAAATRVTVRLFGTPELTTLEIEDDGSGFASELPPAHGRMGLNGMKRRVELLGGDFRVESRAGGPTTVTASLRAWRPSVD